MKLTKDQVQKHPDALLKRHKTMDSCLQVNRQ